MDNPALGQDDLDRWADTVGGSRLLHQELARSGCDRAAVLTCDRDGPHPSGRDITDRVENVQALGRGSADAPGAPPQPHSWFNRIRGRHCESPWFDGDSLVWFQAASLVVAGAA